mmetsp:Transcript_14397/g.31731  ORF Transcript_14397/g.31731 Transcript_14397/m.31731 type:complete len:262 (-) Transcript_14397:2637-3422(-)
MGRKASAARTAGMGPALNCISRRSSSTICWCRNAFSAPLSICTTACLKAASTVLPAEFPPLLSKQATRSLWKMRESAMLSSSCFCCCAEASALVHSVAANASKASPPRARSIGDFPCLFCWFTSAPCSASHAANQTNASSGGPVVHCARQLCTSRCKGEFPWLSRLPAHTSRAFTLQYVTAESRKLCTPATARSGSSQACSSCSSLRANDFALLTPKKPLRSAMRSWVISNVGSLVPTSRDILVPCSGIDILGPPALRSSL